jgi:hypothetical protein
MPSAHLDCGGRHLSQKSSQKTGKRSGVMKISSILRDLLGRIGDAEASDAAWADDPYAHPDISVMTERERADLPPTHMPAPRLCMGGGIPSRVIQPSLATCA